MKSLKSVITLGMAGIGLVGCTSDRLDTKEQLTVIEGDPDCADVEAYLGVDFGDGSLKIDPPVSGTYPLGGTDTFTATFTPDLQYFDWSATTGIDAIIVKAGAFARVWVYDPEEMSGVWLSGLIDPSTYQPYAINRVEVCYDGTPPPPPPPPDDGCTLTPGYWKTHSAYGPAPADDTWLELADGPDTDFFVSGQSWYEVLWTAPAGNTYYILAHAYAAAVLNGLNGASTASVDDALDAAEDILDDLTPAAAAALTGSSALRRQMVYLAGILDDYNNGLVGPEHCD